MSFIDDLLSSAASPLDRALAERRSAADTLRFLGDLEASFPDRPSGPARPAGDTAKFQFEQVLDPITGGARMALVDRETGDILGKSLERAVRILDDAPQQEGTDWNNPLGLDGSLTAPAAAQRQELILDTLFAGNREPGPFELPGSEWHFEPQPELIRQDPRRYRHSAGPLPASALRNQGNEGEESGGGAVSGDVDVTYGPGFSWRLRKDGKVDIELGLGPAASVLYNPKTGKIENYGAGLGLNWGLGPFGFGGSVSRVEHDDGTTSFKASGGIGAQPLKRGPGVGVGGSVETPRWHIPPEAKYPNTFLN